MQGLTHALCGGVLWLELERFTDIGCGRGQFVGPEVEAGEYEVGGDVGLEVQRSLGFGAGVGGVAAVFADLSETGVSGGAGGVGCDGGLEFTVRPRG